jgi:hypothetical protein
VFRAGKHSILLLEGEQEQARKQVEEMKKERRITKISW